MFAGALVPLILLINWDNAHGGRLRRPEYEYEEEEKNRS